MKRGFIPLVVIAIISLVGVVIGGGIYLTYRINQLEGENEITKAKLEVEIKKTTSTSSEWALPISEKQVNDEVLIRQSEVNNQESSSVEETLFTGSNVNCNGKIINDSCSLIGKIFYCGPDIVGCVTQEEYLAYKICNGKTWDSRCREGEFLCPSSGEPYCKSNSNTDTGLTPAKLNSEEQGAEGSGDSAECKKAKDELNRIEKKVDSLEAKYDSATNDEQREINSRLADLAIESSPIRSKMYSVCYNYLPEPDNIYNTNCTEFGDSIRCTTYSE